MRDMEISIVANMVIAFFWGGAWSFCSTNIANFCILHSDQSLSLQKGGLSRRPAYKIQFNCIYLPINSHSRMILALSSPQAMRTLPHPGDAPSVPSGR